MFWGMSRVGRPFGGIRPRRITYWLGDKAYGTYSEADYAWHRDRWGMEMRLNPFYYLDRSIIAFGTYDLPLHHFLEARLKPGMICFDVGANLGTMSLHIAKLVGRTGQVHAFEPVPAVRARLETHVARNNLRDTVRVVPAALSDRDGTATMVFANEATTNQGQGSLVHREESVTEECQVPLTTVDAYVAANGLTRVDFMKIDIQGAEPLLLAGGKDVFGRMSPDLVMEVSPGDLAGLKCTPGDLYRLLEGYGYNIYNLNAQGRVDRKLSAADFTDDFSTDNVFCTKTPH
jgi:FkbM family methyltransferase